jgi:hypothetical protein
VLVSTVDVRQGQSAGITAQDVWTYQDRALTSATGEPANPEEIAVAVRTELTTELDRIDVDVSSRASQASVDALPGAAAVNTFNDTTYDGDGVLITQGTISSGTPANTLTIGTPLIIASTGAGIDVDFEFELGTARVSELVVVGYYTGASGAATSKYASVYLWDYSLAVPAWVLITDGSNRIPHGATNVTRQYVISPQFQDPATGQVKVRYLSSRTTNGDTLVIDQHYVQGVNTGFTLDEIANAVASYRIDPIVAQDGTHSRLAWYLYRGVAAVFGIDSLAGNVLTLSGDRFDATAYYVGRVMQFHLGGTNQYTFARVVAQSGADLTIDQVPANLDDTWHGYILPEAAAPTEAQMLAAMDADPPAVDVSGLATSGEIAALEAHGDATWATAEVSGLALETTAQAILLDTGTTIPATLADLPADIDTQLSSTHGAGPWGAEIGAFSQVYTITVNGLPAAGVYCRMTTDLAGLANVSAGTTNAAGQVTFTHDLPSGTTVYIWRVKAGVEFDDPDVEVIP